MNYNYADRRNDKNIINKKTIILDSNNPDFKGKIALIQIDKVCKSFIAKRPDGSSEIVIDNDYKIMTFFPEKEAYCMTVMYDNNCKLLQWYFDITKCGCKYESGIPYNEDMYLDVVALPNGDFYTLDENELEEALNENLINKKEFDISYASMDSIKQMLSNNFKKLEKFTKESFETLIKKL